MQISYLFQASQCPVDLTTAAPYRQLTARLNSAAGAFIELELCLQLVDSRVSYVGPDQLKSLAKSLLQTLHFAHDRGSGCWWTGKLVH